MDNREKELVFEANRKSKGIAYLFWLFLGAFGAHRFYAGEMKSGAIQLVLTLTGVGLLVVLPWLLIDLFLIPGLINERNMELINTLNYGDPRGFDPERAEPLETREEAHAALDPKRQEMLEDLRATGYRKERRDLSNLYR